MVYSLIFRIDEGDNQMVQMIIRDQSCKGCGLCAAACPKGLLIVGSKVNALGYNSVVLNDSSKCTGCALCARMCPDLVIEIFKETA